ncbi:MAG: Serine--tRNA ligase, mitochondrial [Candelina mexicana]|nr:MAG: Serine--tRNA ligase, mitochondrial [Candelina mexicana]
MAFATRSPYVCLSCRSSLAKTFRRSASSQNVEPPARPSIAPKPILDIKHIRRHPDLYWRSCEDRKYTEQIASPHRIVELFEQWTNLTEGARGLRERNNRLQATLENARSTEGRGDASAGSTNSTEEILEEARTVKRDLVKVEKKEEKLNSQIQRLALQLPNLIGPETPIGEEPRVVDYINTESMDYDFYDPEKIRKGYKGAPRPDGEIGKSHVDIGTELQLLDFVAAGTSSGWGWYFLTNEAALLEQALVQYALSVAMKRGWMVVSPPSVVYSHISEACGYQPRDQGGKQQVYSIKQRGTERYKPELCLAGTAEIPLAAMKVNKVLEESSLPIKVVGASRCYRAEAGARGIDTKGLYRVHEFTKVEMFAWTMPDERNKPTPGATTSHSEAVFDEILSIQTEILETLNLHCRILEMPSRDLGASATRKRDIEAFFPSRLSKYEGWGEVTSASICTDYQSRRLRTRVRPSKSGSNLEWPHTVNGTALAVPRVLAALLENGWDEENNTVLIPEVLRPWMGGMDYIRKKS